ncbi:cytochrome P450 family protein [Streptomyces sp. 2A115]|uniref:cytochrome P450 family protein n=1 Tax=Streptomyces sp. 2A115 TaxID=3457439 RepID=UPI003FD209D9
MSPEDPIDLSVFEPGFTRNPYRVYDELRTGNPVCRVTMHGLRGWLVTRYDDVRQALSDPSLSNDRRAACPAARSAAWLFADEAFDLQHHMLRSDPPRHTRIRRLVSHAFAPRSVARLQIRIEQIAHELVDRFVERGNAELISMYAFPLPLMIIMEILGIPPADRERLYGWSNALSAGAASTEDDVVAALTRMRDFFRDLLERKQDMAEQPEEGEALLDILAVARYQHHTLDQAELLSSAFQLLQGGHVTTLGLIANGMLALLREPDALAELKSDPGLMDAAVDELLRFDPPMEIATVRFTTAPTGFGGVTIPGGGEPVLLALASANRDPARFARPHSLDLRRDSPGHLAFAHGAHYCLGAHLARLEARIAFQVLIQRLDDLALAVDPDALEWRPNPHLRRPETLPVTFTVRDRQEEKRHG